MHAHTICVFISKTKCNFKSFHIKYMCGTTQLILKKNHWAKTVKKYALGISLLFIFMNFGTYLTVMRFSLLSFDPNQKVGLI